MASGNRREFEGGAQAVDPAGSIARAPVAPQSFRSGNRSDGFSWRLAAFYAALFGFSGIIMPFFPAWLQAKGLNSGATGIVLAVPMFIRLISVPSLARLADRRNAFRGALHLDRVRIGLSLRGPQPGEWIRSHRARRCPGRACHGADHAVARRLRTQGSRTAWPRLRPRTALGFGRVRVCQFRRRIRDRPHRTHSDHLAPVRFAGDRCSGLADACGRSGRTVARAKKVNAAGTGKLLLSRGFWVVTGGASLIQASHAVLYGFSVLDWRATGLDAASIGGLWGLAVIAEIAALFAVSARFPQRIGSLGLIGVGAFGAVLRWGVMSFNPPLMLLPMLQLLHAFSFGATHLGSMQLLARRAPARQFATAQGDFATVLALVMAGGMALSGALYADLGDRAYAVMALAAALGGVLVLLARSR